MDGAIRGPSLGQGILERLSEEERKTRSAAPTTSSSSSLLSSSCGAQLTPCLPASRHCPPSRPPGTRRTVYLGEFSCSTRLPGRFLRDRRRGCEDDLGRHSVSGAYDDEEAAAHAYDLAALKYWGRDTVLNFPVSPLNSSVGRPPLVPTSLLRNSSHRPGPNYSCRRTTRS